MNYDTTIEVLSLWRGILHRRKCMGDVLAEVCREYNLSPSDLKGPSRRRQVAWPRQDFMVRSYALGHLSLPQIGRFLGGRDHTTVLHGVRAHAARQAAENSVPSRFPTSFPHAVQPGLSDLANISR